MVRRLTVLLLCTTLFLLVLVVPAFAVQEVKVNLDGDKIEFDVKPVIKYGRVLVPIRQLVESMGGEVTWNPANRTVKIVKDKKNIVLTLDSTVAKVDEGDKFLDVPAAVIDGRTMIPLRFVSENMDAGVKWDNTSFMVEITIPQHISQAASDQLMDAIEKNSQIRQLKSNIDLKCQVTGRTETGPLNLDFILNGIFKADLNLPGMGFEGKVTLKQQALLTELGLKGLWLKDKLYYCDPLTGKWAVETIPSEVYTAFEDALALNTSNNQIISEVFGEVKNSGLIKNLDYAGEKVINGKSVRGISAELSGFKISNLISQAALEQGDISNPLDPDRPVIISKIKITYWVGKNDNFIYGENIDFKFKLNGASVNEEATIALTADVTLDEINKPQQFTVPDVTVEPDPSETQLDGIF